MLIIENRKNKQQEEIIPTFFPDGTSQVWKINPSFLEAEVDIIWHFDRESELIHLHQLLALISRKGVVQNLFLPFLPYGRQDKEVTNNSTFAFYPFQQTIFNLKTSFIKGGVYTVDAHNPNALRIIQNIDISKHLREIIGCMSNVVVVFPDEGACKRYGPSLFGIPQTYAQKVRDQATGNITHIELKNSWVLQNANVLIVDDLADGGATFIALAGEIKKCSPENIELYVTHGIFSRSTKPLFDSGISKIYTTNTKYNGKGDDKTIQVHKFNFTEMLTNLENLK